MSLIMSGCGTDDIIKNIFEDDEVVSTDTSIQYDVRKIYLKFSEAIDEQTLNGNVYLMDKTGSLVHRHTVELDTNVTSNTGVIIVLNPDFDLEESWIYTVVITSGLKTTSGKSVTDLIHLNILTASKSPFLDTDPVNENRTKIVVISDIHMNEQRAEDDGYTLFSENTERLTDFLEHIRLSPEIKELVILGDLMDMWVVPMAYKTFHDTVTDKAAFFQSVADATLNKDIINKINQIANEGKIRFSYVPGNHDMDFDESIFYTVFPNGHWKGDQAGTGVYYPEADIAFEHGHNYDLFNAPDPLTTTGSLLPPGYFITRIYATHNILLSGTNLAPAIKRSLESEAQELAFKLGWDLAVDSLQIPNFDPYYPQIVTGIDSYENLYSSKSARNIYAVSIGPNWEQRQLQNGVYDPEPFVMSGLNGTGQFGWFGSLEASAILQYFIPDRAKIVVFGHTHDAMIKKGTWTEEKIYANSGTWVDTKYLNDGTVNRTCVVLNSSTSTGSDLDSVTVYQYEGGSILHKIGEEYLVRRV